MVDILCSFSIWAVICTLPTLVTCTSPTTAPSNVRSSINNFFSIAGTGPAGSTGSNGLATAATFNSPRSMWKDSLGVIYVSEYSGCCVRKFSYPTGVLTDFGGVCAAAAAYAGDGGPATSAKLMSPATVGSDSLGYIYIGDDDGNRIRMISNNIMSTMAGTGGGTSTGDGGAATSGTLFGPYGLWVDSIGQVYTACGDGKNIRKVTRDTRIISLVAGTGTSGFQGDGGAATAALVNPRAISGDTVGGVYIGDYGNNRIRFVSTSGTIDTVIGNTGTTYIGEGTPATAASLSACQGVAVDTSNGDVYVSSTNNNRVQVMTGSTGLVYTYAGNSLTSPFAGDGGAATAATVHPVGLFLDSQSRLLIADNSNNRILLVYSVQPTSAPSFVPSFNPTVTPTILPSIKPSVIPTLAPTVSPSIIPSIIPSVSPSIMPTTAPSIGPSIAPSVKPTIVPSLCPSNVPSIAPSLVPSLVPSVSPSICPSIAPSVMPTVLPSKKPTVLPSVQPSTVPTAAPSVAPTIDPTIAPTVTPTIIPSVGPTFAPSIAPSVSPTIVPTVVPTVMPTVTPSVAPSIAPSITPSVVPTIVPTIAPSLTPTMAPSTIPSMTPSAAPTIAPTVAPTVAPSIVPSIAPSIVPSITPTIVPTIAPTLVPTVVPSCAPSIVPSMSPSVLPSIVPSFDPTVMPSVGPTIMPSQCPTIGPSLNPTVTPSECPSIAPSISPSILPSIAPSVSPSIVPTIVPTVHPTENPSESPSVVPSIAPTVTPTEAPSVLPSVSPSIEPSMAPSTIPTVLPSLGPTILPSKCPSYSPSLVPTIIPTVCPSVKPSLLPSVAPSIKPSVSPSLKPSLVPSRLPSICPSTCPSLRPSVKPTTSPSIVLTKLPTEAPSNCPSVDPTILPSVVPSMEPTQPPSEYPTVQPTAPSLLPSLNPTTFPSEFPSAEPSIAPSAPTFAPTITPTIAPTFAPTIVPTISPSTAPTITPTLNPTIEPSIPPSNTPTIGPTIGPTLRPTVATKSPSILPTIRPSIVPSGVPLSIAPSLSSHPSQPTKRPSPAPTAVSAVPTIRSNSPSKSPTCNPSVGKSSVSPSIASPASGVVPSEQPFLGSSISPTMFSISLEPTLEFFSAIPSTEPTYFPSLLLSSSSPTIIPSLIVVTPSTLPSVYSEVPISTSYQPSLAPATVVVNTLPPLRASLPSSTGISIEDYSGHPFKIVMSIFSVFFSADRVEVFSDIVLASHESSDALVILGSNATSTDVLRYSGAIVNDSSSRSCSILGDVNGDGNNDVIIGDPYAAKCYVLFGTEGLMNMTTGFTIFGESSNDLTGWSVSDAGDVNNDTISDIIVGAPFAKGVGAVYVIYGRRFDGFDVYLSNLTASQGFVVYGAVKSDFLGVSVSNAGDVNGDKCDDVIIGSVITSEFYSGAAYLIFGGRIIQSMGSIGQLSLPFGVVLSGSSYMFAGCSVSSAGDVNGDGYDDVIIGSSPTVSFLVASAYIVYGSPTLHDILLSTLTDTQGIRIVGEGAVVGTAGDVDHDGFDDVLIGALPKGLSSGFIVFTNLSHLVADTTAPTVSPTDAESLNPSARPTRLPSMRATPRPSRVPTVRSTSTVTLVPTIYDTQIDTILVSMEPSESPSVQPSLEPSEQPTIMPSVKPSVEPSVAPSYLPTVGPLTITVASPTSIPTQAERTRSPHSIPTRSPTTLVTSPPLVEYAVDGSVPSYDDSVSTLNTRYVVNASGSAEINPSSGKCIYAIVPGTVLTLTISRFNVSTDQIDVSLYSDVRKFSDLVITAGSVIITLSSQVIHILGQEPADMSAENFIFRATAAHKPSELATAILVVLVLAGSVTLLAMSSVTFCWLQRKARDKVAAALAKRKFIGSYDADKNGNYILNKVIAEDSDEDSKDDEASQHTAPSNEEGRAVDRLNLFHFADCNEDLSDELLSEHTLDSNGDWKVKEEYWCSPSEHSDHSQENNAVDSVFHTHEYYSNGNLRTEEIQRQYQAQVPFDEYNQYPMNADYSEGINRNNAAPSYDYMVRRNTIYGDWMGYDIEASDYHEYPGSNEYYGFDGWVAERRDSLRY